MRLGCLIFVFRSQIGRQLASLAFLASLLRVSPCLTVTFLRLWALWAATILAWPRCTAWTGSAAAGRANAEARTAAPRPVATLKRIVRVSSWAWVRAKESSSSCTLGWPDGTGPLKCPCATTRLHGRAPVVVRGAGQEGRRGGAPASGRLRAVEGRGLPQKTSRRPTGPIGRAGAAPLPQMLKNVRFG